MTETQRRQERREGGSRKISAAGLTDAGKVRDHNEDAFFIAEDLGLFIVSDGMGGHEAGEMASAIVVKALPVQIAAMLDNDTSVDDTRLVNGLRYAISELSVQVHEQAVRAASLRGMGATVVACLLRNDVAAIAHMGDSRTYLVRDRCIELLTQDHTVAGVLMQLRQITRKDAMTHPGRSTLTRYVGMEDDVGPDVQLLDLRDGDRLLLCSDGLTNMVDDRTIGNLVWSEPDLSAACRALVNAANEAGGKDNVTVLIVQYGDWDKRDNRGKNEVSVRRTIGRSLRRVDDADLTTPDLAHGEAIQDNTHTKEMDS